MTFVELFGSVEKIALLDFLGDHPTCAYALDEISEFWGAMLHNISPKDAVDKLVKSGLINKVGTKYQLNTGNAIIKAVLRYDFEEGKKEADRLAAEE